MASPEAISIVSLANCMHRDFDGPELPLFCILDSWRFYDDLTLIDPTVGLDAFLLWPLYFQTSTTYDILECVCPYNDQSSIPLTSKDGMFTIPFYVVQYVLRAGTFASA